MNAAPQKVEWEAGRPGKKLALKLALVLGGMLALPVVGFLVLEGSLVAGCKTTRVADGVTESKIAWQIDKSICRGSDLPYHDVAFGALDKPIATALTSWGEPVPLAVVRIDEGHMGVQIDRPWAGANANNIVPVRMRRAGSPAERIDLNAKPKAPLPGRPQDGGRAR